MSVEVPDLRSRAESGKFCWGPPCQHTPTPNSSKLYRQEHSLTSLNPNSHLNLDIALLFNAKNRCSFDLLLSKINGVPKCEATLIRIVQKQNSLHQIGVMKVLSGTRDPPPPPGGGGSCGGETCE